MIKMVEIECCAACPFQRYKGAKPICFKTQEIIDSVDVAPPPWCPLPDKAGDDIFKRIHDHPEICIFGGPKSQEDADSPRYEVKIIGPESLMNELMGRIDNSHE